jgi:hypothetical protein
MSYQIITTVMQDTTDSAIGSIGLPPQKISVNNLVRKYGYASFTGKLPAGNITTGGVSSASYTNPGTGFQIPNKCKSITFTTFYALQIDTLNETRNPTLIFSVVSQKGTLPTQYYSLPWSVPTSAIVANTDYYNVFTVDIPIESSQWLEYYFLSVYPDVNMNRLGGRILFSHKYSTIRYNF